MTEQIIIFFQIVFIDLVLAGDNAIIIGMVASKFPIDQRKKIIFWGIAAAVILRIIFTLITAYLLQITGLRLIGGILLLYICYKLYVDVIKKNEEDKKDSPLLDKLKSFWEKKELELLYKQLQIIENSNGDEKKTYIENVINTISMKEKKLYNLIQKTITTY